jgi:hypothetical protein
MFSANRSFYNHSDPSATLIARFIVRRRGRLSKALPRHSVGTIFDGMAPIPRVSVNPEYVRRNMVMSALRRIALDSPPLPGGKITRAADHSDDTAQPPLTSGFGAVMAQERAIQSSTAAQLAGERGSNTAALEEVLRGHQAKLGANIALLEQRYETLPSPTRFTLLRTPPPRLFRTQSRPVPANEASPLTGLIAQHVTLLRAVDALITLRPDGQRGELILGEIARNHEEMGSTLTAVAKENVAAHDALPVSITAAQPMPADSVASVGEFADGR